MKSHHVLVTCILLVAVVLALATVVPTRADEISPNSVTVAVETWVRHVTTNAQPNATIARLEPYVANGKTVAYVVHLADGGYCICGADDRLLPVYLYNAGGVYDPMNPNYQAILSEIAERYAKIVDATQRRDPVLDQYRELLAERAAQWRDLSARLVPVRPENGGERGAPSLMTLPLASEWGQGSPYNDICPELTPGADEHTLVGCVATAMAQIMYYWKWPSTGSGNGSTMYYWRRTTSWISTPLATDPQIPAGWPWFDPGNRLRYDTVNNELEMNGYWDATLYEGAQKNWADPDADPDPAYLSALSTLWGNLTNGSTECTADFDGVTHDWNLMQDVHTDPADSGDFQAALISYHAAVSVNMEFGISASSSFTSTAAWAYRTYFDYDPDAFYAGRSESTMIDEIQWFRPVQLRGHNNPGGHSWVIVGYNTNTTPTQFLMNMGWNVGSTDWYSCDEMFPYEQGHAIRIAPESVVRFVDNGTFGGDGSPGEPYLGLNGALTNSPDNTTLIMKAGSTHALPGDPVVMDKPMTLKGYDVYITKE
ncbi:MAG: C10 family peptidase [Planctomycetota bacterium]